MHKVIGFEPTTTESDCIYKANWNGFENSSQGSSNHRELDRGVVCSIVQVHININNTIQTRQIVQSAVIYYVFIIDNNKQQPHQVYHTNGIISQNNNTKPLLMIIWYPAQAQALALNVPTNYCVQYMYVVATTVSFFSLTSTAFY